MFGGSRRRRPSTAPLNSTTANPNATTAAASAFMSAANLNPNKALSSAAAAAALRARPQTPTNVAEVQTKRTARRSASISSSGSARRPNGRLQLERWGSSASMTERTFRSPSPHRPSTPASGGPQPPVPQIPDSLRNAAAHSRKAGTGMQNFRTASQRSATHSWYGQPAGDTNNVRRSDITTNVIAPSNVSQSPGDPRNPRPDSRSSVNFSYPTVFRAQSPPASPTSPSHGQASQQLVYDPNSRRMVPKRHVEEAVEFRTKQAADEPLRRKNETGLRKEGSRLAKGTVTRPKGTVVEETRAPEELAKLNRQEQPFIQPKKQNQIPAPEVAHPDSAEADRINGDKLSKSSEPPPRPVQGSPPPSTHNTPLDRASELQTRHLASSRTANSEDMAKESHVVRGDQSRAQESRAILNALDDVPTRQTVTGGVRPVTPESKRENLIESQDPNHGSIVHTTSVPEASGEPKPLRIENRPVMELAEDNSIRRSTSNSPARQARFAPGLAEKLAVKHAPLPRSASPIKSAMKHSNAVPRETSPAGNASDPFGLGMGSPNQKGDSAMTRRRSVRVSFDDKSTVVVGESSPVVEGDSPATASPQTAKRGWLNNIGRNKRKDFILDDDEIMAPRPALPSFGSIRQKKIREPEERRLVRPVDVNDSPATSSPELRPQSSSTLNDSEPLEDLSAGPSSDRALGSLLHGNNSRVPANTSRFREPLPPEVTSVEGSGYHSDSVDSTDIESSGSMVASIQSIIPDTQGTDLTQPDEGHIPRNTTQHGEDKDAFPHGDDAASGQDIPQIAIHEPNPTVPGRGGQASSSSSRDSFELPGRFPDDESETGGDDTRISHGTTIFEPSAASIAPDQAISLPQTTLDTVTPVTDRDIPSDEESEESIYSDAYEEIPDVDSSGFMSLDAIVEGPARQAATPTLARASEALPNSTGPGITQSGLTSQIDQARQAQSSPPKDVDDWEQAKSFWRSLTAERRKQLELEAAEDAGAEGDRDEAVQLISRHNSVKRGTGRASSAQEAPAQTTKATRTQPAKVKTHRQDQDITARADSKRPYQESPNNNSQASNMPKTLRNGPVTTTASSRPLSGMRKTMRADGEKAGSAPPLSGFNRNAKPRAQSLTVPSVGSQSMTRPQSALQRRGSDSSDSSFKRNRPNPSGTFLLRKTMRQPSPIQSQIEPPKGSGRFSLRSLSPAGSSLRHYASSSPLAASKNSMANRTLRSDARPSHGRSRSPIHIPLFGKSSKSSARGSKLGSRFDDSSDEDGVPPAHFKSRLEDSSDEEDARPTSSGGFGSLKKATLRASATSPGLSRPAPVREVEENSSELPDSDDEFMLSPLHSPQKFAVNGNLAERAGPGRTNSGAIGTSTLGRSGSGRGGLAASVTAPSHGTPEKRGSFMNILRRNKATSRAGKIHRSELVDSAARRDTKLERDSRQLKDLRTDLPSSPRLQKRNSSRQSDVGDVQRPGSAGDIMSRSATTGAALRSSYPTDRRSVSFGQGQGMENHDLERAGVEGPGLPKKKKFGALRRIFKLDE
ncbi:hypothetical protein F5Y17DRAFT_422761 [Xylariaceae sp. FL0594]|nr:hypothetical protein F5Y17DRAFT_422761 [Xylariaceae sp. FL0594]